MMELTFQMKDTFFMAASFVRKKLDNFFFEEGLVSLGDSTMDALETIKNETSGFSHGKNLVIIDKYFTNVRCMFSRNAAFDLKRWTDENEINLIAVFANEQSNCFEAYMKELFGKLFYRPIDAIHDRFWVFFEEPDGESDKDCKFCIISVGGSFNGFGKKISLINMIPQKDAVLLMNEIIKYLGKKKPWEPQI